MDVPRFPDRLQVRLSISGASTNVGTTATGVGDFTTLMLDINPSYRITSNCSPNYPNTDCYQNDWTQFTVTISGLMTPTTGRFAFRYFVENGGRTGSNSDTIGIDTLVYSLNCSPTATPTGTPTSTPTAIPTATANRTLFDYDGDHKTDISVFRPSTGNWLIQGSQAGFSEIPFGSETDKITPADYDNDGRTDIAVFRPSLHSWFVFIGSSNAPAQPFDFGNSEDFPAPSDGDGDGRADFTVFQPPTDSILRRNSANRRVNSNLFGASDDIPVIGDFDGDGKGDSAVFRRSDGTWRVVNSSTCVIQPDGTTVCLQPVVVQLGNATDIAVPGDYDGDGFTNIAVYRPSTATWLILDRPGTGLSTYPFGRPRSRDIPAPGDYDGDGKTDLCLFQPEYGLWTIRYASNGMHDEFLLGTDGDIPTPSAFLYIPTQPSISGTVTYGNAIGSPNPRFVSNVLLIGTGSPNVFANTDSPGTTAGQYTLNGFGAGSYTVTPQKTTGQNSITSFDAGLVARYAAGIGSLNSNQLIVADVSGNGGVTSFDSGQIARYAARQSGSGATGNWIFGPVNRTYSSVASNITGEDFIALLMGEVSGNWTNTGARAQNGAVR